MPTLREQYSFMRNMLRMDDEAIVGNLGRSYGLSEDELFKIPLDTDTSRLGMRQEAIADVQAGLRGVLGGVTGSTPPPKPTLATFIATARKRGLSDSDIQSLFKAKYGKSPIDVDLLQDLTGMRPQGPPDMPRIPLMMDPIERRIMLQAGMRPTDVAETLGRPPLALGAMAKGLVVGAIGSPHHPRKPPTPHRPSDDPPKDRPWQSPLPIFPIGMSPIFRAKSAQEKGFRRKHRTTLIPLPVVLDKMGMSPAAKQAAADFLHVKKERQGDPRILNLLRGGGDALVGLGMMAGEPIAAAVGLRTPEEARQVGEQMGGGMVGGTAALAKALVDDPGGTFQAYPFEIGALALGPLKMIGRAPLPRVANRGLRRFDTAVQQAAQSEGLPATSVAQQVVAKIAKKIPQTEVRSAAPQVRDVSSAAWRSLMNVALVGDLISPAVAAAVGGLGPPAVRGMFQAALNKLRPGDKAYLARWLKDWTEQATAAETDLARDSTVEAQHVKQAVAGVGNEVAARAERGAEGFPEFEAIERGPAQEFKRAPAKTGELIPDPEAIARVEELGEYAAASEAEIDVLKDFARDERALGKEAGKIPREAAKGERKVAHGAARAARQERALSLDEQAMLRERAGERAATAAELREQAGKKRGKAKEDIGLGRAASTATKEGGGVQRVPGDVFVASAAMSKQIAEGYIRGLKADLAENRSLARATANPAMKKTLGRQAKRYRQAIREMRADIAAEGSRSATIQKLAKSGMASISAVARAIQAEAKRVAKGRKKVAAVLVSAARAQVSIAQSLRAAAAQLRAKDAANAARHMEAAKRSSEAASRLRAQAKELAAPHKKAAVIAEEQAQFLRDLLKSDKATTPEDRMRVAGYLRDVARGDVPLWTTDAVLNSGLREIAALVNHEVVGKQAIPQKTVNRWFNDALTDDGLSLLHDAGVRGWIYASLADELAPPGKGRAAFIKKLEGTLDDAMVEVASTAAQQKPSSLFFRIAGKDVSLADLVSRAVEAMETKDPQRAREWRAGALRKVALHVGTQAEKAITARAIVNELNRFADNKGNPIKASQIAALLAKGETPPQVLGKAAYEAMLSADPKIAKEYAPLAKQIRKFLEGEKMAVPEGVMAKKGYQHTMGFHLDAIGVLDDMNLLFGKGMSVGQHGKIALTALRYQTHANNIMANLAFEALRRGVSPIGLAVSMAESVWRYRQYTTGKMSRPADIMRMRALVKAGLDTSFLSDVNQVVWKQARTQGLIQAIVSKTYKGAIGAYRFGDTVFKLNTAEHAFGLATDRLAELAPGRYIEFELPGGRVASFRKIDGKVLMDGKPIAGQALADVLAKSAMVVANKAFFDYGSGPGALKALRKAHKGVAGIASAAHPFAAWSYYAMDVPGFKKGLMSNLFEYNGSGFYRTNDPKILGRALAGNVGLGLKRAMLISTGKGMLDRDRDTWGEMFGYTPSGGNVMHLVRREGRPLAVKSFHAANMFGPTEAVMRSGLAGFVSMYGGDWLADPKEWGTLSATQKFMLGPDPIRKMKKLRKLWIMHSEGRLVDRGQVTNLLGISGGLLEGVWRDIARAEAYGQPPPYAKIVMRSILPIVIGGTPAAGVDTAIGLFDPYSELSSRAYISPEIDRKHSGPEGGMEFFLRKMLSVGPRPVAAHARPERWSRDASAHIEAGFVRASERRIEKIKMDTTRPKAERDAEVRQIKDENKVFRNVLKRAGRERGAIEKGAVGKLKLPAAAPATAPTTEDEAVRILERHQAQQRGAGSPTNVR